MKRFKLIDTWISIVLIGLFALLTLIKRDSIFITGYFVVGGWQVISMIIHAVNGWFCYRGGKRLIYHWFVAIIIIVVPLSFVLYPLVFLLLFALLFAAPFMAVYYTWICYDEVYVKMQRPMDLLK